VEDDFITNPTPAEINLLVASLYAEAGKTIGLGVTMAACPLSQIATAYQLRPLLKKLPHVLSSKHLVSLRLARGLQYDLLHWICDELGDGLKEVTAKLQINAFDPSIRQFVVPSSTKREKAFNIRKTEHGGGSIILFHGTRLCHLQSIVRHGLKPLSGAGGPKMPVAFMAVEPSPPYTFALGDAWNHAKKYGPCPSELQERNFQHGLWNGRPDDGVLLGCEVAGRGSPDYYSLANGSTDIHTISREDDIMVRYVFIIPSSHYERRESDQLVPKRAQLEQYMLRGFKTIASGGV